MDRFRSYKVVIDGEDRGRIKSNEVKTYDVDSGIHSVVLRINFWGCPAVKVAVLSQTRLVCRSTFAHAFGLMALVAPGSWIQVREEDTKRAAVSMPILADISQNAMAA